MIFIHIAIYFTLISYPNRSIRLAAVIQNTSDEPLALQLNATYKDNKSKDM